MRILLIAILVLSASVVNAATVVVLKGDVQLSPADRSPMVDARFFMDTKTGEGFVKASVTVERWADYPMPWCQPLPQGGCVPSSHVPGPTAMDVVYDGSAKIEGLMLMGDQAVYQAPEGNVVCGTMGISRVFKVPTLYLSGNCTLFAEIRREGRDDKIVVTLKTK